MNFTIPISLSIRRAYDLSKYLNICYKKYTVHVIRYYCFEQKTEIFNNFPNKQTFHENIQNRLVDLQDCLDFKLIIVFCNIRII